MFVEVRGRHTGVWMGNLKEGDSLNNLSIDDDNLKETGCRLGSYVSELQSVAVTCVNGKESFASI
jgi:hypothetical protein